jgi:prophage antirepressor-like protein
VGGDVAKALGYCAPKNAIANHVDDEDKTTASIQCTGSNYKTNVVIINESGLYSAYPFFEVATSKRV